MPKRRPSAPPSPADETGSPALSAGRGKLLLVVFGLLLAVAVVAATEGLLALAGLGGAGRTEDPFVGFVPGRDLFGRRTLADGREVWATEPGKLAFFNPQQFPVAKAPGTYRVFAVGGSTTAGRPYDAEVAFPRFLELYLADADPSRPYEVINAGAISYASYRIVVLMRELVRYQPDAFVIYTGHNEFLEERTYGAGRQDRGPLGRLRVLVSRLRLYDVVRRAVRGGAEPTAATGGEADRPTLADEVTTRLEGWTGLDQYRRDPELERAVVEHFAYNLGEMVATARDAGAAVVLVEPLANLKDFSPFKSEHREGLSPADETRYAELLGSGRAALAAGDPATALAAFDRAVALDPDYAEGHFRRGRALLAAGEVEAARAAFVEAKDRDVAPLRALEAIRARIRALAEREGVPIVPLPRLVEPESLRLSGDPIPGDEILLDHVHPDIPTHAFLAERLIDALAGIGEVPAAAATATGGRKAIFERVVGGLDREDYARRDLALATVLGWAGKLEEAEPPLLRAAEVLVDDPDVALDLGIVYQRTGRTEAAIAELERAVELAPGSAPAWFNLGVALARAERLDEAADALEKAVALRSGYAEASYNLGVVRRRLGDADGAIAALERALAERPSSSEVWTALGLAHRLRGDLDRAIEALERSAALDPSTPAPPVDLGITLARAGRLAEAEAVLRRASERFPGSAEALYNLGVVHGQRGETEAAEAAYRRAVEADPEHAPALTNLAVRLATRGELVEASRLLVRAIDADPTYADAYFNLGVVYDAGGEPREALRAIGQALELDPDNARYRQAADALRRALDAPS